MENFFYDDKFYGYFEDFIEDIEEEYDCEIEDLPEDFSVEVSESELKPILILSIDDINIESENYSDENEDNESDEILKVLKENIDFEKINSLIPKNYHRAKKVVLTKEQLLSLI